MRWERVASYIRHPIHAEHRWYRREADKQGTALGGTSTSLQADRRYAGTCIWLCSLSLPAVVLRASACSLAQLSCSSLACLRAQLRVQVQPLSCAPRGMLPTAG